MLIVDKGGPYEVNKLKCKSEFRQQKGHISRGEGL